MSTDEYNGWSNRETWCAALWINNDQGWQEQAHELVTGACEEFTKPLSEDDRSSAAVAAGDALRDHFEELAAQVIDEPETTTRELRSALHDIGSLYRVNWYELGDSILTDLSELDEYK